LALSAKLVEELVSKAHEMEKQCKLICLVVDASADDTSSWWEMNGIYEVPLDAPASGRNWPNYFWDFGSRKFGKRDLHYFDGCADDPGAKEAAAALGAAVALDLHVPLLLEPPGIGGNDWWKHPNSPLKLKNEPEIPGFGDRFPKK